MILKRFNYSIIEVDAIRVAILNLSQVNTWPLIEKCRTLSNNIAKHVFIDMTRVLSKDEVGIILDDSDLEVEECDKMYGNDSNIIFCLGTSRLTTREMKRNINSHDTRTDWSKYAKDSFKSELFSQYIKQSKENEMKCKNLKNIKYIDTSYNRKEVLNKVINELETLL